MKNFTNYTTNPIVIQIKNAIFVTVGSWNIKNTQNPTASIGTTGTKGTLNGLFKSGLDFLRSITDKDTTTKIAFLIWITIGFVVYAFYGYKHSGLNKTESEKIE